MGLTPAAQMPAQAARQVTAREAGALRAPPRPAASPALSRRLCGCGAPSAMLCGSCMSCDSTSLAPQRRPAAPHPPLPAHPAPGLALRDRLPLGRAMTAAPGPALGQARLHPAGPAQVVRLPLQTRLRVAAPGDAAEQEAEAIGERIAGLTELAAPLPRPAAPLIQGRGAAATETPADVAAELRQGASGAPLPGSVRGAMEARFGADFSAVRVHTNARAATLSARLGARAFTLGRDVYFARDEFRPHTAQGRALIAHELTHTIQQSAAPQRAAAAAAAPPAAAAPRVVMRAPAAVQRFGVSDALDKFAGYANAIPGFRMLTIVLGVNPISMAPVDRSAANILRAIVEFIPGGALIVQALNNSGVFEKAGAWISDQLATLGLAGSAIKQAVDAFLASLTWSDIFDLGGVWERAKRIFTEPIDRLINFAKGLLDGILKLVKDAILKPLAQLASQTRAWDLLIAVLGRNPITGEVVPRTAETLIGGFLKLIGKEDVWQNMQKANAIPRAWAWFQGAMSAVVAFVSAIPDKFIAALTSLTIADVVLVAGAFAKIAGVFGDFVGRFIDWAGTALWDLAQIIIESVSPGALAYIKKTGAALKSILLNPLPFVSNLVRAARLGFQNFADHFGTHLKAGLIDWLTGSLPGVYIPKAFELPEIVKFVLSVLGISWGNVRAKLVRAVGETAVKAMEAGFDVVVTLVRDGPAAAWDKIKEQLTNLKDMVIGGITDFIIDMVVQKAIPKLVAMFIPGAGFISAILSIYDTVMVFVNKLSQIAAAVTAFIDSIVAIAGGDIGGAAAKVEGVLARLLSLAINFLAGFAGLGRIADKVLGVIKKIQSVIDKALDKLVDWIAGAARKLGRFIAQAGLPQDPQARLDAAAGAAAAATRTLAGRAVTRPLLAPILAGIKLRYGLTSIEPFEQDGNWWVRLAINPVRTANLGLLSATAADLGTIKAAFGTRLFTRAELAGQLHVSDSTALSRINDLKASGVLFVLASAPTDLGTQYSFDSGKAGQRETNPNNRAKYGYSNPNKRSSVGLQILTKGLRADSPPPILATDASYHEGKARYDSWRGRRNFGFPVAILGHKDPGASGHWNTKGHQQTRDDNQAWNRNPDNYAGPEHEDESSASGGSAERYRVPSKAAGSHSSWW